MTIIYIIKWKNISYTSRSVIVIITIFKMYVLKHCQIGTLQMDPIITYVAADRFFIIRE